MDFEIRICSKDITIVNFFFEFDDYDDYITFDPDMINISFYLIGWQKTAILWYHKKILKFTFTPYTIASQF